ncbi:MAG: hypothetical protein ACLP50_00175 [Solirubrobacteraceae bacterium]
MIAHRIPYADRRAGSRPQPGDDERLELIWSYLRPLLVPGRQVPTVALDDAPTSRALGLLPARRSRLVFRRALLEWPVEVVRGEVAHEYAHTFKPPTMLVALATWLPLVVGELVALAVSFSSGAPLLGNPFVVLLDPMAEDLGKLIGVKASRADANGLA